MESALQSCDIGAGVGTVPLNDPGTRKAIAMVRWNELGVPAASDPRSVKGGPRFPELSVVVLRRSIAVRRAVMPAGARGTVVGVYRDQLGYEVEFNRPFHAVLTIEETDLNDA